MAIGSVCCCDVVTTTKDTSIFDVAKLMKKHNIGDVVVVDETDSCHPVGMVTDRDITTKILAEEMDAKKVCVGDVMSEDLLLLKKHQGIQESLDMMCAKGVRRAPVIDEDNKLAGIATVDDLLIIIADEMDTLGKLLRKQINEVRKPH